MADLRLRELDRQAAAGDPQARARSLRERMRSGEQSRIPCRNCDGDGSITWEEPEFELQGEMCSVCQGTGYRPFREAVELAAYAGDEAARLALGGEVPFDAGNALFNLEWFDKAPLDRWIGHLDRWGQQAQVRSACAAARVAYAVSWQDPLTSELGLFADILRAIEAADAWCGHPCAQHWQALRDVLGIGSGQQEDGGPTWAWLTNPARAILDASRVAGEQPVRDAICRALAEWALC